MLCIFGLASHKLVMCLSCMSTSLSELRENSGGESDLSGKVLCSQSMIYTAPCFRIVAAVSLWYGNMLVCVDDLAFPLKPFLLFLSFASPKS